MLLCLVTPVSTLGEQSPYVLPVLISYEEMQPYLNSKFPFLGEKV